MKSLGIILLTILMIPGKVFPQDIDPNSSFAFGIGTNLWLQSKNYMFSPYRYHGELDGFTALPVDAFTEAKRATPIANTNFYTSIICFKNLPSGQLVNLELGLAQSSNRGNNPSGFRYIDQIDEDRGFVKASVFVLDEFITSSQYLFIRPKLQFDMQLFNLDHRFGVGIFGYLVLHSNYSLEMRGYQNEIYYYRASDIKMSDWLWQLTPEISYQLKLGEAKKHEVSIFTSLSWRTLHFTQRKIDMRWPSETIRPIFGLGLIYKKKKNTT